MENFEKFEEGLLKHLSSQKVGKTTLKKYSSLITDLRKQNLVIERIWRYGQPVPDGIIVRGRLKFNDFAKLEKFFQNPDLRKMEIFPLGVPFPDFFDIRMQIGEEIENVGYGI